MLVPGTVVLAAMCALWLWTGVDPEDAALFIGYEAFCVILPGVALWAALGKPRGALDLLAIGWPLGLVLQALAFIVASATGAWPLLGLVPVVVLAACAVRLRRAGRLRPRMPAVDSGAAWLAAALCIAAFAGLYALTYHDAALPGTANFLNYNLDLGYDLSLAGEVKHHFPPQEPQTAGEPFAYHSFAYLDAASVSRVIGVELATVLLRLQGGPVLVLLVLQLIWAASLAGSRGRWALLAPVALLLLGEIDLDLYEGDRFANLLASATMGPHGHGFAYSLAFFLPAVALLGALLGTRPPSAPARTWAAVALLLVGAASAKGGSVLPVLGGGLGAWAAWRFAVERQVAWRTLVAAAGTGALFVLTLAVQYRFRVRDTEVALFPRQDAMKDAVVAELGLDRFPVLGVVDRPVLLVLGLLGSFPALIVGFALARSDKAGTARSLVPWQWLASLYLVGLVPLFATTQFGNSHLWPYVYGASALALLAPQGLERLWLELRHVWPAKRLAAAGGLWVLALALAAASRPLDWLGVLERHWSFGVYSALALSAIALVVVAAGRVNRLRKPALALLAALVLASALDLPVDAIRTIDEPQAFEPRGLSAAKVVGLRWVREHSDANDVLAVNNQAVRPDGTAPSFTYYSALAERRVMLGGYDQAVNYADLELRSRLNHGIFERADRSALREATARFGVRYLVADLTYGPASPRLGTLGERVFANGEMTIYRVSR